MSDLRVDSYSAESAGAWDALVTSSWNGTFMHSRRFLSYHRDRFTDRSLLFYDDRDRLVGVLPAALSTAAADTVVSHPGSSYGGVVHAGKLTGGSMIGALELAADHYRRLGLRTLSYKAVPYIYHQVPAQDDLYALQRLGAQLVRRDLSSVIDLHRRRPLSQLRKRGRNKALREGVEVRSGKEYLPTYWTVLKERLGGKFGVKPTHSLPEIQQLQSLFPEEIECRVAVHADEIVAGVVMFKTMMTVHTQYIAANDRGYELAALDLLFPSCIEEVTEAGHRYLSFGISTEDGGRVLNEGLYNFKGGFGGGGIVHEFYELAL